MSGHAPSKLLPCPFCGGEAKVIEGEESAYVQCMDMSMHRAIWFSGDNTAAEQVSEQWNRRAANEAKIEALTSALLRIAFNEDVNSLSANPTKWPSEIAYIALGGRIEDGQRTDGRAALTDREG